MVPESYCALKRRAAASAALCLGDGVGNGAPLAGGMPPASGPSGRPIRVGEVTLRSQAGFPGWFLHRPEQLHGVAAPHVQGWGMRMSATTPILAIDVSKHRLD